MLKASQPAVSLPVFWLRLPTEDVPLSLGSRTIPVPQLPASNRHSSQELNPSCYLFNSSTNSADRLTHSPAYNIRHGPHRKHFSSVSVQLLPWKCACLRSDSNVLFNCIKALKVLVFS
jgi:hypothetical protein